MINLGKVKEVKLPFTEEQLDEFDDLVRLGVNAENDDDMAICGMAFVKWSRDNDISIPTTHIMKDELIKRNRW